MLENVTVVEFGTRTAVGFCGKLLQDAGARVIKVEPPVIGDRMRTADPVFAAFLHGGKASVALDVTGENSREQLTRLLRATHVAIVDEVTRDVVRAALPNDGSRPILVTITDYGDAGPGATEFVLQAESGIMALHDTGTAPPVASAVELGEMAAGIYAALGSTTAMMGAAAGAVGVNVDVSVLESLANLMPTPWLPHQLEGHYPYVFPFRPAPGMARARDGWVCLIGITSQQWAGLRRMIGDPVLDDPRFETLDGRVRHGDEIAPSVRAFVGKYRVDELARLAASNRVPLSPVVKPEDAAQLPPFVERGRFVKNPATGAFQPGAPWRDLIDTTAVVALDLSPVGADQALVEDPGAARERHPSDYFGRDPQRPLRGFRVVDLTHYVAGPVATQYLAYAGADVIHVESVGHPDHLRMQGVDTSVDRWWERNGLWHGVDKGKRDILVDLTDSGGRKILRQLIATADVVVENFSARVVESYGLGHDDLRKIRPDLVIVRMPAFGLTGSWSARPGMAFDIDALSGLAYMTGGSEDPPSLSSVILDFAGGAMGAFVASCGLWQRAQSGEGAAIELALADTGAQILSHVALAAADRPSERVGNASPTHVPQDTFQCMDGLWVALSVPSDAVWEALRSVVLSWGWKDNGRYGTIEGRASNRDEITAGLRRVFAQHTAADVVDSLRDAGVPIAAVASGVEFLTHPRVRRRERVFTPKESHAVVGRIDHLGYPMQFSYAPAMSMDRPPPLFGENTVDVLREIGRSEDEIREALASGLIAEGARPAGAT